MDQHSSKLVQNGNVTTATAAVIRNSAGHILLGLRHYTPDKWQTVSVWTTPGGRCEEGEALETNLRRETEEETGITELSIEKFLGTVPGAKEGDVVEAFLCTTGQNPKLMEPEKFSEWKWFSSKEIPENFINPALLSIIQKL